MFEFEFLKMLDLGMFGLLDFCNVLGLRDRVYFQLNVCVYTGDCLIPKSLDFWALRFADSWMFFRFWFFQLLHFWMFKCFVLILGTWGIQMLILCNFEILRSQWLTIVLGPSFPGEFRNNLLLLNVWFCVVSDFLEFLDWCLISHACFVRTSE